MSTPVGGTSLPTPTIPLTPELRAAYQELYDKIQSAIDSTMDLSALEALNKWQPQVDRVLTLDQEFQLSQDTQTFSSLQRQICDVNDGLMALRAQISSIASHFEMAGDIIAAIDKIVSLLP